MNRAVQLLEERCKRLTHASLRKVLPALEAQVAKVSAEAEQRAIPAEAEWVAQLSAEVQKLKLRLIARCRRTTGHRFESGECRFCLAREGGER